MKLALVILSVIAIIIIVLFIIYGMISRKGIPPGLDAGMLSQCSTKPNCVCSEVIKDKKHYLEPLLVSANTAGPDTAKPLPLLKNIILNMGGVLQAEKEHYASFTFSSAIFGFVDDMEIRFDPEKKLIHFRSASRVGTSDFGVNKKRVELLRKLYLTLHTNR